MLDPLSIVQTEAQQAAVLHVTVPRDQIQEVMGPAITEVIEAVIAQGIGPAGPVFAHHFEMQPGTFNFEVGVPVTAPVQPSGRVKAGALPAATVGRTIYTGPYEGLGDAWGEFMECLEAAGHQPAANLWERYLTGPESGPDASTYRTELNRPLL
jgi:effector-binding domain-containing protein